MSKIVVALCALLLLTLTPSVQADPIVVTSGSLTVPGVFRAPQYSFAGGNFSVVGQGGEQGASPACSPCKSGDLISINSLFVGASLGGGSLTVGGSTFQNLLFGGTFQFTGNPILIPGATTNITLTAPFTFSGNLAACPLELGGPDCTPSNQVFSAQFIGQGIATLQLAFFFVNANGDSLFGFQSITYNFQIAQTPEPTTITLLATGLSGFVARRAFRKRKAARKR